MELNTFSLISDEQFPQMRFNFMVSMEQILIEVDECMIKVEW